MADTVKKQTEKNLQTLASVLTAAKKAADDMWAKTTLEQRMRMWNNILRRVEERKAKQNSEVAPC